MTASVFAGTAVVLVYVTLDGRNILRRKVILLDSCHRYELNHI